MRTSDFLLRPSVAHSAADVFEGDIQTSWEKPGLASRIRGLARTLPTSSISASACRAFGSNHGNKEAVSRLVSM